LKRPIILLFGIIISIVLLSLIYPTDPGKIGLLDRMIKSGKKPAPTPANVDAEVTYSIYNTIKIDDQGEAIIWSPDETDLYYSKPVEDGKNGQEELWVLDSDDGEWKIISELDFFNIRDARWSPDGNILSFISGANDGMASLIIYDSRSGEIKDITPQKVNDIGITSYDWESGSNEIMMSLDIVNPKIEIYNLKTEKARKLNIKLKSSGNAAFYTGGRVMFSDIDDTGKYMIYTTGMSGDNIKQMVEGRSFKLSPDKKIVAILSDEDGQDGLWIYRIETNEKKNIITEPISNIYWLSSSFNLIYSTEEECSSRFVYREIIHYIEQNLKVINITNAVYPVFVPSAKGSRIAMSSPQYIQGDDKDKGLFIGRLSK
jgi:Tol biopolymer transport system component